MPSDDQPIPDLLYLFVDRQRGAAMGWTFEYGAKDDSDEQTLPNLSGVDAADRLRSFARAEIERRWPERARHLAPDGKALNRISLYVGNDVPHAWIVGALDGLATLVPAANEDASSQPWPVLLVSVPEFSKPRLRHYGGGRLPPEEIQKVIRTKYDDFRRCYEIGLTKSPSLEGRVTVRFVIGRDGKVTSLSFEPNTDLADRAALECIAAHYRQLEFPPPRGGIVTVVYPIIFAPSE